MRSSTSLVLAASAALALSLGLKTALALTAPPPAAAPPTRSEQLRRFLAANAGAVEAAPGDGWRIKRGACEWLAIPSGKRGSLDLAAKTEARRSDRIAYVYRGRITAEPPAAPLAVDIIAYMAMKPFRAANEPGYVVLITRRGCTDFPDLPWSSLPIG